MREMLGVTALIYGQGMSEEARERRRKAAPLAVEGTGWDVGYAALYLASDASSYTTGSILKVDGGAASGLW